MAKFIRKRVSNVRNDVLSGLTVALALVPATSLKRISAAKFTPTLPANAAP